MIGTSFSVTDAIRPMPAQEDKASQNCYDDTNDHWINAEGAVERSTDRVGLYHVAEKAECQRNQDRKDNRKYFAERTFVSARM